MSYARRATLRDVAADAGVSASTVSRALNGDPRIRQPTRARVEYVAARLGYVPNQAARSLVLRATHTLGLLVPEVTDPIHGQVVAGFEGEASAHGYSVIMANGYDDPAREAGALQLFARHQAEGIAVLGCVLDQRRVLAAVRPSRVVFVDGENPALAGSATDLPLGCIRADDRSGAQALVQHLLDVGCRTFAYVAGPPVASTLIREQGIVRALGAAGLERCLRRYAGATIDQESMAALVAQVAADRPDALLCYDDKLALAVMDALRSHGLQVPDDVVVTGFDDIPFAALANPRLTTVAQPAAEMGRLAVNMLLAAMRTTIMPPSVCLAVQLMVRESSARPIRASPTGR
jgi:DNA-binding LacI/PurR family transcriptional regulator